MKLQGLFIANTIVSVPFGVGSVLVPNLFLSLFGGTLTPAGAVMMQYGGAWLIGVGLLTWFTRNVADSGTLRAICWALLPAYLVALVVSVVGQLGGVLNALGWMPVVIQLLFAFGFGTYLLKAPR